jgi:hypothetical protein
MNCKFQESKSEMKIDADLDRVSDEIMKLLREVHS